MAHTDARPREALFVEWPDIDFDRQQIVIRPKPGNPLKSGKARHVELQHELKAILLAWREEWRKTFAIRADRHPAEVTPPHAWVFYNPRKQLERADSFNTCFDTIRRRSNLPQLTPYTLRHFFVSYCVMNGIDFLTIARWVGHNSTHMIEQVYGHLTPEYRARQMGKFNIAPRSTEQPASVAHRAGPDAELEVATSPLQPAGRGPGMSAQSENKSEKILGRKTAGFVNR